MKTPTMMEIVSSKGRDIEGVMRAVPSSPLEVMVGRPTVRWLDIFLRADSISLFSKRSIWPGSRTWVERAQGRKASMRSPHGE